MSLTTRAGCLRRAGAHPRGSVKLSAQIRLCSWSVCVRFPIPYAHVFPVESLGRTVDQRVVEPPLPVIRRALETGHRGVGNGRLERGCECPPPHPTPPHHKESSWLLHSLRPPDCAVSVVGRFLHLLYFCLPPVVGDQDLHGVQRSRRRHCHHRRRRRRAPASGERNHH